MTGPAEDRSSGDTRGPEVGGAEGMPRWVRATLLIGVVVVILVVVMLAFGHGPGQHGHAGGAASPKARTGVLALADHADRQSRAGA